MTRGESELKTKVSVERGAESAKELRDVDKAQKQVGTTAKEQTSITKEATEVQDKQNASTETFAALLGQVHPALGAVAMATINATKIASDYATKQINVRGAVQKATAAIKTNIATLKLLGATTAVVAGIALVIRVVKELKKTITDATDAFQREIKRGQEATKVFREQAEAIREAANQRQRMAKMDIAESEATVKQAKAIARRFPAVKVGPAANLLAQFSGAELSPEQLEQLVLAQAGGAIVSPDAVRDLGSLSYHDFAERKLQEAPVQAGIKATRGASDTKRRQQAQSLLQQAQRGQGEELEALIRSQTVGRSEEDLLRLREIIKNVGGTTGGLEEALREGAARSMRTNAPADAALIESQIGAEGATWLGRPRMFSTDQRGLNEIARILERIEAGLNRAAHQPTVGLQYNFATDARAQAGRETNGQNMRDAVEGR